MNVRCNELYNVLSHWDTLGRGVKPKSMNVRQCLALTASVRISSAITVARVHQVRSYAEHKLHYDENNIIPVIEHLASFKICISFFLIDYYYHFLALKAFCGLMCRKVFFKTAKCIAKCIIHKNVSHYAKYSCKNLSLSESGIDEKVQF